MKFITRNDIRFFKYILTLALIFLLVHDFFGQTDTAKHKWRLYENYEKNNALYGELLGGNYGVSINYERSVLNRKHFMLNVNLRASS